MNAFERFESRLNGTSVDRLPAQPIFMIHAADLIGSSYKDYLLDFRILVAGQMAALERYPIDVVSCCSDAWREAADCGVDLVWGRHLPPHAAAPLIQTPADLLRLSPPDPEGGGRMTDRLEAVRAFQDQVKSEVPIQGWIEGPLAEAVNLCGMNRVLTDLLEEPAFIEAVMDFAMELGIRFAVSQVAAGADIIGIGDAAASLLAPEEYAVNIAPREKKMVDAIHAAGARVRLHICGDVRGKFHAMASTGADILDIDSFQGLKSVREAVGNEICLSGNVHPVAGIFRGTPESIRADFAHCHRDAGERYILGAGCEIPPGTPEENIQAMFSYALSAK